MLLRRALLVTVFWLLTLQFANGLRHWFVAAPTSLRLNVPETIVVTGTDLGPPQELRLSLYDHPGRRLLWYKDVYVGEGQTLVETVTLTPDHLPLLSEVNPAAVLSTPHYVVLAARAREFQKEALLLVNPNSGYVIIQTDKPIYTPQQKVNLQIIGLNEDLRNNQGKYKLQIRNPQDIAVLEEHFEFTEQATRFFNYSFSFPSYSMLGSWKAIVFHGYQFQLNSSAPFELEQYVLPSFSLHLVVPDVILPHADKIIGKVDAEYVYGKKVAGTATFKMGVKRKDGHVVPIGSINNKQLEEGHAEFIVDIDDEIKNHPELQWFPEIAESRLVVEVIVTEHSTGKRESLIDDRGIFAPYPYELSFKRSLKDFKPGLPVLIQADINYVQGDPAPNVPISISVRDQSGRPLSLPNTTAHSDQKGQFSFLIPTRTDHTSLSIHLITNDLNFGRDMQAVKQHSLVKFSSKSNSYIALVPENHEMPKIGDSFKVMVYTHLYDPTAKLHFVVVSRGRLVSYGDVDLRMNNLPAEVRFTISQDMAPRARLVVFTHHSGELLADSLLLDIRPSCSPYVQVSLDPQFPEAAPGTPGKIVVKGHAQTLVGLIAVDRAVYLLKKNNHLTHSKLFSLIGTHDQGCGAGGGYNSDMVLDNAGIVILTDVSTSFTPRTEALKCREIRRKKRALTDEIAGDFEGEARQCCHLGMKVDKYQRSCAARAAIVKSFLRDKPTGLNCSQVFLRCCNAYEERSLMLFLVPQSAPTGPGGPDDPLTRMGGSHLPTFIDEVDELEYEQSTLVRHDFRETWIFDQIIIGSSGQYDYEVTLPHSITEWTVQAVSLSLHSPGICVAEPEDVRSFKPIFLQMDLPYSVVVNEQLELRPTVYNYLNVTIPVVVYMYGVEDLCSGVQAGEKSERHRLMIKPHSTDTVAFPVVPMQEGKYSIRVVALSPLGSDVLARILNVVPKGTPVEKNIVIQLDPSNQQRRKRRSLHNDVITDSIDANNHLQQTAVTLRPPQDYIPGTESCIVMAIGDQYGPTVETAINGVEDLISKPTGCGEQTMIHMAPTLYALHYLAAKNRLTPEVEQKAYDYLKEGYKRILTYRKYNGAFSVWTTHPPSTWLTAFVAKILCGARRYIAIDDQVITTALNYLAKQQRDDGSFREVYTLHHPEMLGGVQGKVPSTAFVLITFLECGVINEDTQLVKERALSYLEHNLNAILEPYSYSIIAYAMALANHPMKNFTNQQLKGMALYKEDTNERSWYNPALPVAVEATSYALLTQLAMPGPGQTPDLEYCLPIVNWLNTQRSSSGSFISTQDTVVGLQALSQYAIISNRPNMNLICNISYSKDQGLAKTLAFQSDNAFVLQQFEVNKIGGVLYLNTTGQGVGHLSVKLRYNVPRQPEKLCKFSLNVTVSEDPFEASPSPPPVNQNISMDMFDFPDDLYEALGVQVSHYNSRVYRSTDYRPFRFSNRSSPDHTWSRVSLYTQPREDYDVNNLEPDLSPPTKSKFTLNLKICVKYLSDRDAAMTILDVGIFSGFIPKYEELDKMVTSNRSLIGRYETSSRGVLFYLDKVPHGEDLCIIFPIIREYIVGSIQASVVKVYDYYDPDEACTTFYSPDQNSPIIRTICEGEVCRCAEGGCPPREPLAFVTESVTNWNKPTTYETKMMRGRILVHTCKENDYAWKGQVVYTERKNGFRFIKFRIEKVFKEGAERTDELETQVRELTASLECDTAYLLEGKTYVIMGKDGEEFEDDTGRRIHPYRLDQTTTIHLWQPVIYAPNKPLQKTLNWLEMYLARRSCT